MFAAFAWYRCRIKSHEIPSIPEVFRYPLDPETMTIRAVMIGFVLAALISGTTYFND